MGKDRVPLPRSQLGERGGHGISILTLEQLVLRSGGLSKVNQLVLVALATLCLAPRSSDQVSGCHDRIRNERRGIKPSAGRHHPNQGFLDHVVDAVRILETCGNDPANDGGQVDDVGMIVARRTTLRRG
jgi:hypothetical protein